MEINGAERKATQAEMLANSPSSTYSDLLEGRYETSHTVPARI